ncbi:MAG: DNA-processing protein DprA [Desulfobacterales bacterium]|nr:DNA-processing protein DprA [Desulfobacterales bacterium]
MILKEIPKLGIRSLNRLLTRFESPERILSATEEELVRVDGLKSAPIQGIRNHKEFIPAARKELKRALDSGIKLVTLPDPHYPALLKKIDDPPPILYYKGTLEKQLPCIAMVGSRRATAYGLNTARQLSKQLADKGLVIVSGMARGIDTAAHQGALDAGGRTLAILGSGLKKIYPKENKNLFNEIVKTGAVISEFKLDTDPFPYNFPARNRIIAGLSCGTVVVEAAQKSGSLITARLSAEYNREVFAVPGSIKSKKSQGTHALLKQGAKLVENETDVLDEISHFVEISDSPLKQIPEPNRLVLDKEGKTVYQLLDPYPRHIDQIIEAAPLDSATVGAVLLELELQGYVQQHPGNYFSTSEE